MARDPVPWPWFADAPAGVEHAFCGYPKHRRSDWRRPATDDRPAGKYTCGVCHPPPPGLEVEYLAGTQHSVA